MSGAAPIAQPSLALPPLALPTASAAAAPAGAAPTGAAAATGTTPSTPTVTVVSGAAQALAVLANGAALSGTIAPSSAGGTITLLTALGTLSLTAALPLPAGTSLTLQAQATNASVATILAVNGSAPLAAPAAAPPAATITSPAAPVVIDVGTTVAATVVTPNAAPPTAPPLVPLLAVAIVPSTEPPSAGPFDSVTIAAVAPVAVATSAPTTTESEKSPMTPALQGGAAAAAPTGTAMPEVAPAPLPGTQLALRVLAVQSAAPGGESSASRPPPALTGVVRDPATRGATPVLDTSTADTPIADTPAGPLLLRGAPVLPAGTRVALRLLPDAPAAAELTVLSEPAALAGKTVPTPLPSTEAEPLPRPVETPPHGQASDASGVAPATSTGEPVEPPAAAADPPIESLVARVTLASPQAPGRPAEQILTGTVLPDSSGGRAPLLVETPLGVLALSPRLAIPAGSLLLLAAQDVEAPLLGLIDDAATEPAKGWSSLASALPALAHAAPALAAQLRADLAPQAGGDRLAATFLFLIDALRNPAGPPWPGDLVAKALAAAGKDDDKTKLAADLGEARRIAAAPATGDWQVFMLPLVEGPAVRPLRLYLKRRDKSRRNAAGESARFVLEFELSRLGALQLDGFVRPRRFDLLLRTKAPMGPALESAVERIFHDRIAAAGLGGTIDFSTVARFDIAPLDGMRGHVGLAV